MKKFLPQFLLIAAALLNIAPAVKAELSKTRESKFILFLDHNPTSAEDLTSAGLYKLLAEDSKEWVESIEAENINFLPGFCGIMMNNGTDGKKESYVKINFNDKTLPVAYAVHTYATTQTPKAAGKLKIYLNDETTAYVEQTGELPQNSPIYDKNQGSNVEKDANKMKTFITTNGFVPIYGSALGDEKKPENLKPLKSIKIVLPTAKDATIDLLMGVRILHYGTTVNPNTAVEEISVSENSQTAYYDLMGNRLQEAPAKGLFIEVKNGKTRKILR